MFLHLEWNYLNNRLDLGRYIEMVQKDYLDHQQLNLDMAIQTQTEL
jgi:hypothetical protein